MDDEKPVLEQMTDMMVDAAHATKEAAKKSREEGQKGSQESYAEDEGRQEIKVGSEETDR
jgi:hypothetical protein